MIVREGVWEKEEYKAEKENLLMKFEEVENCTFAPLVRSKMPDKLKISKDNPDLLYGKPEKNRVKLTAEYTVCFE